MYNPLPDVFRYNHIVADYARPWDFMAPTNKVPIWAGLLDTTTLAFSRASIFDPAVPFPPEMIAPACPILLPGGAVTPAMKETTGFCPSP